MSAYSDDDDDYAYEYDSDEMPGVDDDDLDFVPAPKDKGKQRSDGVDYRSLSLEALRELVAADIGRVASLTGLQHPIATILLQHFRWNEDKLLEKYIDSPQNVLREVGEPQNVAIPSSTSTSLSHATSLPSATAVSSSPDNLPPPSKRARFTAPEEEVCMVCLSAPGADGFFSLRCGHTFCRECWAQYTTAQVRGEGRCLFKCMQDGCLTHVDEDALRCIAAPTVFERYQELLLQSYVGAHADLRFCPHPGCTETVCCAGGRGQTAPVPTVRCGAGHAFCFGCGHDADHRPVLCAFVPRWMKSAREDAGTSQWIKANTRMCPRCQNNIEKNGGCNRIVCRHCNFQFCWLCMKKWDVHGYNSTVCNAWQEPEPDAVSSAAKQNLEKWLFYFDRFNNHELSAKLDRELCERTAEKMVEVQETSQLSWIEAKFMQEAVDELTECRVSLKWSYVMAYFMQPGNQKQIFEDIQADLEKAVEDLSQMLEEPVETETVKSLRQRMVDKTVYVRQRRDILLQDTAAGLAEGRWTWTVPIE